MNALYMIALGMVQGVGNIGSKRILAHTGSAEAVFRMDKKSLTGIPGVGSLLAERILDKSVIGKAGKELEYIKKNNIKCMFYYEGEYPENLRYCEDAPLVLYSRGELELKGRKILSVVGTRRPSSHGLDACRKLIRNLAERYPDLAVVSGLAYGIDHCAHKTALECGIETIAVLGHGLKFLYPSLHRNLAEKIESSGALATDFSSCEKPEKNNFIKRNRIIAGLSEATIVVESGIKGGALITADLANSYNREVFAFPGRISDPSSTGCNRLIKSHKAALIENYRDVEYLLGWEPSGKKIENHQKPLFSECSHEQQAILQVLQTEGESSIDLICFRTGFPVSRILGVLLDMEFAGMIRAMPGDYYRIVR